MRSKKMNVIAVTLFLVFCASLGFAQQPPNEAAITQMKGTVEKLEGLVGDANIPPETRQQLNELLFEKRGDLHALLRQKRDALRSSLRGNMAARESNAIASTIRQLDQQMRQLVRASTAGSATVEDAHSQSGTGSDPAVPSNDNATGAYPETATATRQLVQPVTTATGSSSPAIVVAAPGTAVGSSESESPVAAQPAEVPVAAVQDACDNLPSDPAPPDVEYQRQITATACRIFRAREGRGNRGDAQLNFQANNFVMALAIARAKLPKVAIPELTAQAEDASHAKNLSAGESSSGSTSLVAKAGVPAILGFAAENGGLTRTTNGSTVTFTGNPVGLVQAMAKKGFIDSFQTQDDFTGFLRKLNFGFSFDTSRGSQPGTLTGDKQQLSGFSLKYNIVDQRDPRDRKHTARWLEITNGQAANLALSLNQFVQGLATTPGIPAFNAWLTSANQSLAGITRLQDLQTALAAELEKLGDISLPPEQERVVKQVGTDFEAFLEKRNDILDEISNGWIATFDYNNTRPVGTPSLSNFRFLAEKGAYKGSIDFTGNASVTIYNSRPTGPNAQTLRDFRFAGQLDVPIGDITKTGKFLISLGGRYQRLLEDEPILGTTLVVPKGDIATFQAKLTIPIRGTAFKIPLSFSYANRTELNKEREIRGNFGFTFDLDSIFAKFNPFTK